MSSLEISHFGILKVLEKKGWDTTLVATVLAALTYFFWRCLSKTPWHPALYVSLSVAAFMVGCIAGFLFTSYGDEAATVGKVRDWLIGGLTGLTIAKFSAIKGLLITFAYSSDPSAYALTVGVSITFVAAGFFFMFFQRELILNLLLAESRDRRGRVEGTKLAGVITHELLSALPPSVLSGIDGIDQELADSNKPEAQRLRGLLESDGVSKFLSQAEESVTTGQLDWDVVSKAATLYYYLVYFARKDDKDVAISKALDWLRRALVMNPEHADLTAKYADILGNSKNFREAVSVLDRLNLSPEAPAYVKQWLGFYLLYVPGQHERALQLAKTYHSEFPDETDSLYNIARAYAQKYSTTLRAIPQDSASFSQQNEVRAALLASIQYALSAEPEAEISDAKAWFRKTKDFEFLKDDSEFKTLVSDSIILPASAAQPATATMAEPIAASRS